MLGSRTDLHIFDAGSVNGTRYCNEILLPYVRLFRGAIGLQFIFMDDNAPCHCTVAAEQLLESENIDRMDRPARSPDINPIEHVWDCLGRRLAARTLPPVTIRELRLALQDEWAAMPQQLIDTLILSMGRRCETCLAEAKSKSKELREFVRGSIVGFRLCGKSVREIADILPKLKSTTVSDVIVKWKRRGTETAEKRTGRPKILGEHSRRTLKRVVKQNRKFRWWKFLRSS
ncbi:transposable element Tcb2 transposase [Trichonephila clavipes]|nr:transposable element Tcb2 transposase [Trichonephila clavipes]